MTFSEMKNKYYKPLLENSVVQFMALSNLLAFSHRPYAYCCKVKDLVADWYGDCNTCPENDATLLSVTIYTNGKAEPIEGVGLNEDITFEVMMEAFNEILENG